MMKNKVLICILSCLFLQNCNKKSSQDNNSPQPIATKFSSGGGGSSGLLHERDLLL